MEQGKFAYRKNLEDARRAVLDRGDTAFSAPTASENNKTLKEGLMRPKARPEPTGGAAGGFGLALLESFSQRADQEVSTTGALSSERPTRPMSRPGSVTSTNMADREILALTLQAEAGGEGMEGMMAAGSVIRNRADSGKYGEGIRGVIMKPGQFSAWNGETGYAGGKGAIDMGNLRPTAEAFAAADRLLSGEYEDITGGATHYYNPNVVEPRWGSSAGGSWRDIGNHRFGFGDGNPGRN